MCRTPLDNYDTYRPIWMERYLRFSGWHFTKRACDYAVELMRKKSDKGEEESITPITKEELDELLKKNNITLSHNVGYDYVYVANMCKADLLGESVPDDKHLAMYVKNVVDDIDGGDGTIMREWYVKCISRGILIDWEVLLGEKAESIY